MPLLVQSCGIPVSEMLPAAYLLPHSTTALFISAHLIATVTSLCMLLMLKVAESCGAFLYSRCIIMSIRQQQLSMALFILVPVWISATESVRREMCML